MGSSSSKAAQEGIRRFPSRPPGTALPSTPPAPNLSSRPFPPAARQAAPTPSYTENEALRPEPHPSPLTDLEPTTASSAFSARLRQMGVASPQPTFSPSSTASPPAVRPTTFAPRGDNATLGALAARRRLQERADAELGRTEGRELLDVGTIRRALALRERGVAAGEIEARLGLRDGTVGVFGGKGVVRPAGSMAT